MTIRTPLFHTVAAIAFLTATPMLAFGGFQAIPPNLQFVEETQQHPSRAAETVLPTCDVKTDEACKVSIKNAFTKARKAKN